MEVFRTRIISLLNSQLDIVKEFSVPEVKDTVREAKEQTKVSFEEPVNEESAENVLEALKTIERVTMELPKIVQNEKGEFVVEDADTEE